MREDTKMYWFGSSGKTFIPDMTDNHITNSILYQFNIKDIQSWKEISELQKGSGYNLLVNAWSRGFGIWLKDKNGLTLKDYLAISASKACSMHFKDLVDGKEIIVREDIKRIPSVMTKMKLFVSGGSWKKGSGKLDVRHLDEFGVPNN